MKLIKISRDRLQRSLSHGYFKKISNSSNSSLTQSDYKSIIDKLDIANQEHAGSVDAIFSLLIKKNRDIENNAKFRNIRNGINAEIFKMGGEYDKKLIQCVKTNAKDIKAEMFALVQKFYNSGYKIIAYDIMRQLSILSEWMNDTINATDDDKNKHKIKEIFSPDSDFHKSFLYLNKIKSLLQKQSLKDELAKFSTEIHTNEKGQVVDIEKCIQDADVGSFFGLLADKGHNVSYVSNSDWGRDYDALKRENPLSTISKIKDSFVKTDKKCNIAREANGKVGIFDINNKNSTQTYVKDKQKRFNDFKTMVLNIFENKEKYSGKLKNKSTDFFLGDKRKGINVLKKWGEDNEMNNIIDLFEIIASEDGKKGRDYNACLRIAKRIDLDDLTDNLNRKLRNIKDLDSKKVYEYLEGFIEKFNTLVKDYFGVMKSNQGMYFLKNHQGLNDIKKRILEITGDVSGGFSLATNSTNIINLSKSFTLWREEQDADLEKDKKFLKQIAIRGNNSNPIDPDNLIENLSPQEIDAVKQKYAQRMLQGNIRHNEIINRADAEANRNRLLLSTRLARDKLGQEYYPQDNGKYPNFYQSPYPLGIYPQQQRLSNIDIQRIATAIDQMRRNKSMKGNNIT